jgi:hypothetical protein
MTRKLLAVGNLDWPTLRGGAPTAFADLLTKQERKDFLAGLHTTALNKDGSEKNTRMWVTSFAPGSTQFITTVIKVHGTMRAGVAADSGTEVLRIKVGHRLRRAAVRQRRGRRDRRHPARGHRPHQAHREGGRGQHRGLWRDHPGLRADQQLPTRPRDAPDRRDREPGLDVDRADHRPAAGPAGQP